MTPLRYAIVGTGAIGGYYGGRLAQSGREVHFLLHSDYEYVKANGLKVDSVDGDFFLPSVRAYRTPQEMPSCDVVFVCLKTTKEAELRQLLPPLLHRHTWVVLIQNGIGVEAAVERMFPQTHLAAGIAYICSGKFGPGYIRHQDLGKLLLAPYRPDGPDLAVLEMAVRDLQQAGVDAGMADYQGIRWRKCVWNIPYNGLTVVMNCTTRELLSRPSTCELVRRITAEVVRAGNACGAHIGPEAIEHNIEMTRGMVPYSPSMKLDFDFGRPMEIEYLYTHAIAEAAFHGVEMPLTQMLEEQLLFIQQRMDGARKQSVTDNRGGA